MEITYDYHHFMKTIENVKIANIPDHDLFKKNRYRYSTAERSISHGDSCIITALSIPLN